MFRHGRGFDLVWRTLKARRSSARTLSTQHGCQPTTIFSGIQPTGIPHLGNYLGALQQWVKRQDETARGTKCVYSIVDLHSITVPQDAKRLGENKRATLATLLAVGLDPRRSTIFFQSAVPAHSELMWILSCHASVGYLSRMTQWKSKLDLRKDTSNAFDAESTKGKLRLGLFAYPVLQAADILVHRATHVPVGHDQSQHLEFARECAKGFNHLYGVDILIPPETILSPAKRIMALNRPGLKMSKSHADPKSRILLTDSKDEIFSKFKSALTDSAEGVSYDPVTRPGVANLIDIAYHMDISQASSVEELAQHYKGLSMRALKGRVADLVDEHIRPIRERIRVLLSSPSHGLDEAAEMGRQKAAQSAAETMKLVRATIGL